MEDKLVPAQFAEDSDVALGALYTAERTDVQNVLGHSLTIISILVAYSAIIGATWATRASAIPPGLFPLIPIPVLTAIAWHSQLNLLVLTHNQSILVIERALTAQIPSFTPDERRWVGATSGRLVSDLSLLVKERRIAVAGGGIIAYTGVMLIVIGLTGSSVIVPIAKHYPWAWVSWPAGFIYLLVLYWLGRCYISSFSIDAVKLSDWAKSAENAQQRQFPSLEGRTIVSANVPSRLADEVKDAAKRMGIEPDAATEQALSSWIENFRQPPPGGGQDTGVQ